MVAVPVNRSTAPSLAFARAKPWLSNAPMSTAPTRGLPRWSAGGAPEDVPASMAGAPGSRGIVRVPLALP